MKLKEVARRCKMCWYVPSEPFDNLNSCDKFKFFNTPLEAQAQQKRMVLFPKLHHS